MEESAPIEREQILFFKSNLYGKEAKYLLLLPLYYKYVSYACCVHA